MADVTGPISSLPGSGHSLPKGMMCDCHPDRNAVARIQGETDSFGCEMIDMCQECLDKEKEYNKTKDTSGVCDWCKQHKPSLSPARDYDEGSCGPVYDVCSDCRRKRNEEAERELEESGFYDRCYDEDDY